MPVPLRIAYDNRADTATLSASSSVGGLSVGKLLTDDIQDIWRAASTTAWVLGDQGTSTPVGGLALMNSNSTPGDVWRVRVSSVDPTGAAGDEYDSGSILAPIDLRKRILAHFIESGVSGRYIRVDLAQATAPQGGRIFFGPVWTPSRNLAYGNAPVWRDWSETTRARGLNEIRDRRSRQKGFTFVLNGLTQAEVDGEIEDLNANKGVSADILVCVEVDQPATKTIWGPMGVMISAPNPAHNFYVAEFTVWNRL